MRNTNLQAMIEAAILAAFALVIDILPLSIKLPTGGSISFAMIPIFIIAYRWGFKASFLSGLVWGLLQIVAGDASIFTPVQAFIEYFVAFAFIGFAGLFHAPIQQAIVNKQKAKAIMYVIIAAFIGSLARYFWHFIAGFIFFGQYAPKGQSAVLYSFIFNGITMIGSFALCAALLVALFTTAPRLFTSVTMNRTNRKKIA
ncbi:MULTISPECIES: energy-coupled thiamine transporter ThiT [unclassified Bacillus (in: firmicutes)]|uniref:energy-coupled thiamine transporter ThiT n=1 Tax=unclassified Bacillus (in: firmicutes) TaxID=185979 RepID=UPI0008F11E73|nr:MULTISPECIES: energy-coupled thiamine transporter ThiT [unclassified Bacillus (in: firmicutes)]SFJ32687.1 thiamine transporter [Bacillus sp. 71mf]SFT01819.1 thiamine transporter [Bacillus sp. 103mf]